MNFFKLTLVVLALCWGVIIAATFARAFSVKQQTEAEEIWHGATPAQAAAESAYATGATAEQIAAAVKAAQ